MKKNLMLVVTTTVLSLVIWVFFEVMGMPLDARDTTMVVAACMLVVLGIRGIWVLLRKKDAGNSGQAHLWIGAVLASGWLLPSASDVRAQSTAHGADSAGLVACAPSNPIAQTGDTLSLTVWALTQPGKEPEYIWSVDAGEIEGAGRDVRWRLTGARPGTHTAKVQFAVAGSPLQHCTVQLIVVAGGIDLRGGHRASGRAWLLQDQTEDKRYGLRSYVLFGAPPVGDEQRERCLRVIEEYLKLPSSERLEKYYQSAGLPLEALNITYLPLKSAPSKERIENLELGASYRAAAEELLRRYDYERARLILGGLEGEHHQGPYIISYPAHSSPFNQPYIFQNQSWVPLHLVTLWMREFLNQAAQERDWSRNRSVSFVLKMRTIITVGGRGFEIVQKSVEDLITYYQGKGS